MFQAGLLSLTLLAALPTDADAAASPVEPIAQNNAECETAPSDADEPAEEVELPPDGTEDVDDEPEPDRGHDLAQLAAHAISRAMERRYMRADDVLNQITVDRLMQHLPAPISAEIMKAALAARSLRPSLILEIVPPETLARHLPPVVLWDIVAGVVSRCGEAGPDLSYLSEILDEAIQLGLVDEDPRPSAADIVAHPEILSVEDRALLVKAMLKAEVVDEALIQRTVGVRVVSEDKVRAAVQSVGPRVLGLYSFDALCLSLRTELMIFARKLARDGERAADVVQESYAKAYKAWKRWRPIGDPSAAARAWMFRIVSNTYTKTYHHGKVRARAVKERFHDVVEGAHGIDQTSVESAKSELGDVGRLFTAAAAPASVDCPFGDEVKSAIAGLVPDHREVIEMFYVEGLGCEDIARRLRIPKNTVFTRLARARAALAPVLAKFAKSEYGYDGDGDDVEAEAG